MSKRTIKPSHWSETYQNLSQHKVPVIGSFLLSVVRAAATIGAVYSLYNTLGAAINLPSNATDTEKTDAFFKSSLWVVLSLACSSLIASIPSKQNALLDPVSTSLSKKLAEKILAAYYNLPYEVYTITPRPLQSVSLAFLPNILGQPIAII